MQFRGWPPCIRPAAFSRNSEVEYNSRFATTGSLDCGGGRGLLILEFMRRSRGGSKRVLSIENALFGCMLVVTSFSNAGSETMWAWATPVVSKSIFTPARATLLLLTWVYVRT